VKKAKEVVMSMFAILAIVLAILFLSAAIKVLREYERGVVFRLGRVIDTKGPGLIIIIPIVDKLVRVSLRLVAMDVPPQDVITRDNVSVKVNAVIYFRVMDPNNAVIKSRTTFLPPLSLHRRPYGAYAVSLSLMNFCRKGIRLTPPCRRFSISIQIPGVLRSPMWRLSISIFRRRCNGPWPGKRRQKGSGGQKSSMPKASIRPLPS
jgi:hypothetical protein